MDTVDISCELTPTGDCPLGISVTVNGQVYFNTDALTDKTLVTFSVNDDHADYTLAWTMYGKTTQHTKIDTQGNIVSDNTISVRNVKFNDLDLGHTFNKLAMYHHDFNGTGDKSSVQFFGTIGCNGTVEFKFSTPVNLWLLENM